MTMVLGLTGSFGSGKSTVAAMFQEAGIPVQDADAVAKDAVAPGTPALGEIVREFGEKVLDTNGNLDRKKMAEIVFADEQARKKLNAIVHPKVREAQVKFLREHARDPAVVLEIPLLMESGAKGMMSKTIVVTASERVRFGRLRNAGFTEREIIARLGSQMPQARKVALADCVIDNDGDREAARAQVRKFLSELNLPSDGKTS